MLKAARILIATFALVVSASAAFAQKPAVGAWDLTTISPEGEFKSTLVLQRLADGDHLQRQDRRTEDGRRGGLRRAGDGHVVRDCAKVTRPGCHADILGNDGAPSH